MQLPFGEATSRWFISNFQLPTQVQARGWPLIAAGQHVLLLAPTGSGKTLAAFLSAIDRLLHTPPPAKPGVRVLYVSPLKALIYDIERNLRSPLVGILRHAETPLHVPRVGVRTGDTSQKERTLLRKDPPDILVTTPESLYLMLSSQSRDILTTVETVIIDEIHSLAPSKRGAHLALSLERLTQLCERDPQRLGLSATVQPLDEIARYLGGSRPVEVVNTLEPPKVDLKIMVPVEDMEKPEPPPAPEEGGSILGQMMVNHQGMAADATKNSIWPSLYPALIELIREHHSTILFVNSRGLCERLAVRLNELSGQELCRAHHGSVSHAERQVIEEALKGGQLKAIVATSSLELGVDMGAVDLVILVESPGSVARGLQRVGRAGHGVGQTSIGRLFPKFRGDLLEATVVVSMMKQGKIEPSRYPRNPLDVLAQQLVAMCAERPFELQELEEVVRRAANYRDLSRELLVEVLDMLSGRYPSTDFADLRPRLNWDREANVISARPGARTLALINGGTIPDRGLYGVFLGAGGPRVGELDEEMVHEVRAGQTFLLGASSWRIEQITRDQVLVSPAPGEPGRMPFWKGDGPGRPIELGRSIGAFVRELGTRLDSAAGWLEAEWDLDGLAASNLVAYIREQKLATGTLPTDRAITVERFRDEIGDWRICILSPYGSRVHAPWALALEAMLAAATGFEIQSIYTDDGIALRLADVEELPELPSLAIDPDEVEELLLAQLGHSSLFASQFRENAGRALLLPRKMASQRTPLWAQRLKAQNLMAVARNFPSFPIILETYRSCLQDTFDLPALKQVLTDLRSRKIQLQEVETPSPSPFARSLVFSYLAAYMYGGDLPLAERRAQALTLDRALLSELLGQEELRDLLDGAVLDELEAELQGLAEERRAYSADALHDLLRRVGDLSEPELLARAQSQGPEWIRELERTRRIAQLRLAGEARWVAVEDVALYRDAFGCNPPSGLPNVFLEPTQNPLESILIRYARTRGPFTTAQVARRFALLAAQVDPALRLLMARHQVLLGEFRPGGSGQEWCEPEVLRRWRRRTLARLRGQVAPVESAAFGRFLQDWHLSARSGRNALIDVIAQLEGLPVSFQELEKSILPARLPDYQPRYLDEAGQMGAILWVGFGALGNRDGRIALYRRERAASLLSLPPQEDLEPIHAAIIETLERRGAIFFMELRQTLKDQFSAAALEGALEDLIWSGHVTNDSLAPVRALGDPKARGNLKNPPLGGRWTLVKQVLEEVVTPTQRIHAWVQTLLDRYGIVSREVVQAEDLPGGFTPIYEVLKAMEESGRVRRGYFVESLSAAQFAWPGVIDRLRAARNNEGRSAVVLSAVDPANPYGGLVPWPTNAGRPRRSHGTKVVLVDGEPAFYLDRNLRRVTTFPVLEDPLKAELAVQTLADLADRTRGKSLRLEEIDGQPAALSPWAEALRRAGFGDDANGLTRLGRVGARV